MPELPEVETIIRGMDRAITGRTISAVDVRRKDLRVPFPRDLARRLTGRRVVACGRRAKYGLVTLDSGDQLLLHLGMSGRVLLVGGDVSYRPAKHDHFILRFDDGSWLVLNDPRRFGMVLLIAPHEAESHAALRHLGPEPLEKTFDGKYLAAAFDGKKADLKAALLDQRVVAGLGNIYVCEALFDAGLSPLRRAGTVGAQDAARLVAAIKDVLRRAIKAGGSSLKDYRHTDGSLGYFQHSFRVYGREGEACPGCTCDVSKTGGIQRVTQAGRSSFFCPRKQSEKGKAR